MNDETIQEVVRQLERLGGPAWEYALRQAYVVGWLNVLYTVILSTLTIIGVLLARRFYKRYKALEQARKENARGYSSSYENEGTAVIVWASSIVSFFFGVWTLHASFIALKILLNPHYEAMKQLSDIIRGG